MPEQAALVTRTKAVDKAVDSGTPPIRRIEHRRH
jgi:hypothetical protein